MKWAKIVSLTLLALGLVIFALIGVLYSFRGTPAQTVRDFDGAQGPPAVGDAVFGRTIELLAGTRLAAGHDIQLLLNGDGTYPRIWQDMRAARRSIAVQIFYAKPGVLADTLKQVLAERARAGVRVRLLLDAFGTADLADSYREELKAAGVQVAIFRPIHWYTLHKAQNRSHLRAIVIDERVGYTGGFGFTDDWLGDGRSRGAWRDTNVRFTGRSVLQLQAAFAVSWAEATGVLLAVADEADVAEPTTPEAGAGLMAGLIHGVPTPGTTPAERLFALTIAGARHRLWISNAYFLPDEDLRRLLIAARARNVDVRVLTAGEHTDMPIVRRAGHHLYPELLRAGVRIYEYEPSMMHAKTMAVDGVWSMVGTMNFDNRTLAFNDESNLLIEDAGFATALEQIFLDDLTRARELTVDFLDRRSSFRKLVDAAAGRILHLL